MSNNKLNRRNFVKTAIAGAAATSLAVPTLASAGDKKKLKLKMQTYWGKEANKPFKTFTDNVKVATNKGIKIKRYPGSAIVPDAEMLEAVSKGTLDLCEGYGGYWPGKVDMALIEGGMPGAWVDYDQARYIYNAGLKDLVSEAYAEKNIKFLAAVMGGPFDLLTKKPVKSLEDLKKMKIRATPSMAKILQKFDIPTVFLPGSELYIALSTGKIDGAIYGGPMEYVGMKLYETAKYYTKLNVLKPGYVDNVLMNMDTWKSLSEEDQKIMQLAADVHAEQMHAYIMSASFDPKYTSKFEFSELPAEESKKLREASQVLWEEEAKKSERTKKAVDILKSFS